MKIQIWGLEKECPSGYLPCMHLPGLDPTYYMTLLSPSGVISEQKRAKNNVWPPTKMKKKKNSKYALHIFPTRNVKAYFILSWRIYIHM